MPVVLAMIFLGMIALLILTFFMAAIPAVACYVTPVSVAIKEVNAASAEVQRFFKALVFLPIIIVAISYLVAGEQEGFSEETVRIFICWGGAVLSRFFSGKIHFYKQAFWFYSVVAAAIWLFDVFCDNESWRDFGKGFVGPT